MSLAGCSLDVSLREVRLANATRHLAHDRLEQFGLRAWSTLTVLGKLLASEDCNAFRFLVQNRIDVIRFRDHLGSFDHGREHAIWDVITHLNKSVESPAIMGTDHLLFSLLETDCFARQVLEKLGVSAGNVADFVENTERESIEA